MSEQQAALSGDPQLTVTTGAGAHRYDVRFRHEQVGERRSRLRHQVTCYLHEPFKRPDEEPYTVGSSLCSRSDAYDPVKGRRVAFARAVALFPRGERAAMWGQFFDRYPMPTVYRPVLLTDAERLLILVGLVVTTSAAMNLRVDVPLLVARVRPPSLRVHKVVRAATGAQQAHSPACAARA